MHNPHALSIYRDEFITKEIVRYCLSGKSKTTIKFIKQVIPDRWNQHRFDETIKNENSKFLVTCLICDHTYETDAYHFIKRKQKCSHRNHHELYSDEFIIKFVQKFNGQISVKAVSKRTIHNGRIVYDLSFSCSKHGDFVKRFKWGEVLNGQLCPLCRPRKPNRKLTVEEFIKASVKIHGDKYDYSLITETSRRGKMPILCRRCNRVFYQRADQHKMGKGCPNCSSSKMEEIFKQELTDQGLVEGVDFFHDKICFNDLVGCNGGLLRFDFYFPSIKMAIELNGIHHFRTIKGYKSIDKLKTQQTNDHIKKRFCKRNKIELINIKYINFRKYHKSMLMRAVNRIKKGEQEIPQEKYLYDRSEDQELRLA